MAIEEARETARERLEKVLTQEVLDALVVVLCLAGLPSVHTDEARRRLRPALNKLAGALAEPEEVALRERIRHLEAYVGTLVEGAVPTPGDEEYEIWVEELRDAVREVEVIGVGTDPDRVEIPAASFRKLKRLVGQRP